MQISFIHKFILIFLDMVQLSNSVFSSNYYVINRLKHECLWLKFNIILNLNLLIHIMFSKTSLRIIFRLR